MEIIKKDKIEYYIGGKKQTITPAELKHIRSKVRTHEGELLLGKKGQHYMDKFSYAHKGKNLKESYRDQKIRDQY